MKLAGLLLVYGDRTVMFLNIFCPVKHCVADFYPLLVDSKLLLGLHPFLLPADNAEKLTHILMKVEVTLIDRDVCSKEIQGLIGNVFCAVSKENMEENCEVHLISS